MTDDALLLRPRHLSQCEMDLGAVLSGLTSPSFFFFFPSSGSIVVVWLFMFNSVGFGARVPSDTGQVVIHVCSHSFSRAKSSTYLIGLVCELSEWIHVRHFEQPLNKARAKPALFTDPPGFCLACRKVHSLPSIQSHLGKHLFHHTIPLVENHQKFC